MAKSAESSCKVSKKLKDNLAYLDQALAVDKNFDIIRQDVVVAEKEAAIYLVDGMIKEDIMWHILHTLSDLKRKDLALDAIGKLTEKFINYVELSVTDNLEDAAAQVLTGPIALVIDGENKIIVIDVRTYPARGPEEPELEKVVRGSRDGFTETIVFNTALIRRRLRDPKLRTTIFQAGQRSKSDVAVVYIEDIADPELVKEIQDRVQQIEIDGLPMAEKSLEELITPGSYWNPYPRIRYTERPDVAAIHLLEGHVLIMVDTSPSVIIAPATFFHHVQHAEEYRQEPLVGVYLRWVRFLGILASLFILPLWLVAAENIDKLPVWLQFLGAEGNPAIPLFIQFILAEIAVDMMRLATIHTPAALSTSLGIIAAILIGDIAVGIGLFSPEVIIYTAIAAVGSFLTPSYELSLANRLTRLMLLAAAGLFGLSGFLIAAIIVFFLLASARSFGVPYLWPLLPFNWPALKTIILRMPVPVQNARPGALKPLDKSRQTSRESNKINKKPDYEKDKNDK